MEISISSEAERGGPSGGLAARLQLLPRRCVTPLVAASSFTTTAQRSAGPLLHSPSLSNAPPALDPRSQPRDHHILSAKGVGNLDKSYLC
jgi:hypothetical protein